MKKQIVLVATAALAISLSSCKPDPEVLPVETVDPVVETIDTVEEFVEQVIDTTQFVERDLEAEFQALVNQKLLPVYFAYNSYELTDESQRNLSIAAEFLNSDVAKNARLKITGHTDERGSTEYNLALGERRSIAVKNYLANYGVSGSRLEVTSMGKEMPATRGCDSDECHFKNRRAEFAVIR